jgi:hypothetical protein
MEFMKNRIGFYITVVIIAILTTFLVLLLTHIVSIADALPIAFSLLALIVSILSSFKNELFPFRLSAFIDGFYLVASEGIPPITGKTIQVLLPITFFNRGYSEGVIKTINLMVRDDSKLEQNEFLPNFEIDMEAFMQQNKGVNASNVLGVFVGFLLDSKRAVKKNVLFSPRVIPGIPPFIWKPGVYHFNLYVQVYGENKPKFFCELKKEIGANTLGMLASGKAKTIFLYPDEK